MNPLIKRFFLNSNEPRKTSLFSLRKEDEEEENREKRNKQMFENQLSIQSENEAIIYASY